MVREIKGLKIMMTEDGSRTIHHEGVGDTYHSKFGALTESEFIFIQLGLLSLQPMPNPLNILELGFGTGLNALLTMKATRGRKEIVYYHGVDILPLPEDILGGIADSLTDTDLYKRLHGGRWNTWTEPDKDFHLYREETDIRNFSKQARPYHLVYFDAFSPDLQPELWDTSVFSRIGRCCLPGAVLVTYSCKGVVRRNLSAAGWNVVKMPGPPGKREVVRAEYEGKN